MEAREIARRLAVSRNTVRVIIRQGSALPHAPRADKQRIDEQLLRRLYQECDGWMARMHEKLVEEEGIAVSYPTLKMIMQLYDSLGYMQDHQNIIWLGVTGCGKTGLATSFLIHAINHGYSARYILFADLMAELYHSVADHSEAKVLKKYLAFDCLQIDELGYVEAEPVQVGHFFTLMHQRHKQKSTLITSNLGFSEWGRFLKNDHLTAALIDRLTENSHVINMKQCVSLRSKLPTEP